MTELPAATVIHSFRPIDDIFEAWVEAANLARLAVLVIERSAQGDVLVSIDYYMSYRQKLFRAEEFESIEHDFRMAQVIDELKVEIEVRL